MNNLVLSPPLKPMARIYAGKPYLLYFLWDGQPIYHVCISAYCGFDEYYEPVPFTQLYQHRWFDSDKFYRIPERCEHYECYEILRGIN